MFSALGCEAFGEGAFVVNFQVTYKIMLKFKFVMRLFRGKFLKFMIRSF